MKATAARVISVGLCACNSATAIRLRLVKVCIGILLLFYSSIRSALVNKGQTQRGFYISTLVLLFGWFLKWTYKTFTVENELRVKKGVDLKMATKINCLLL